MKYKLSKNSYTPRVVHNVDGWNRILTLFGKHDNKPQEFDNIVSVISPNHPTSTPEWFVKWHTRLGNLILEESFQAPTTRPLRLGQLDKESELLLKEWRRTNKKILPPTGFARAEEYTFESLQRKRCAEVKAWVLQKANGVCESCGTDAPFFKIWWRSLSGGSPCNSIGG